MHVQLQNIIMQQASFNTENTFLREKVNEVHMHMLIFFKTSGSQYFAFQYISFFI